MIINGFISSHMGSHSRAACSLLLLFVCFQCGTERRKLIFTIICRRFMSDWKAFKASRSKKWLRRVNHKRLNFISPYINFPLPSFATSVVIASKLRALSLNWRHFHFLYNVVKLLCVWNGFFANHLRIFKISSCTLPT